MKVLGFDWDLALLADNAVIIGIKIIVALLIFFIGRWLAKKSVALANTVMSRSKIEDTVASFLSRLLYGVLLVVVVLSALNHVGIHTTSIAAILGGAAVAIGLSLKDQLSNFAAGIMIITFRPFVCGDYVQINTFAGTISQITLINTHLTTVNNHDIIIPNGSITTSAVTNFTALSNRRVDITIKVGFDKNLKAAKATMLKLANDNDKALKTPEPTVQVTSLGDSSVELTLNVWSTNKDWWEMQCELLEALTYALKEPT
ncbi:MULTISPECIES: mechanosensitive ion channel family protein [Psychrobacter]|uniref:mechanosensitive ion channel family protein n=1 Tax=Psychrobacter TaxID=497 RepID=UPI00146A3C63|nr:MULTISPECIES: mechanosensitive ion channel domain-containing protein [Psychrobacter]